MHMELLWLLVLSVPVFYVLGVVQLISWFTRRGPIPHTRPEELQFLIKELTEQVKETPTRTLREQLEQYKKEWEALPSPTGDPAQKQSTAPAKKPDSFLQEDVQSVWTRWYATNSINLLLYLGAFFIVASASI